MGGLRALHQHRSDLVLLTHSDSSPACDCAEALAGSNLSHGMMKGGTWSSIIQHQILSEINAIVSHENLAGGS